MKLMRRDYSAGLFGPQFACTAHSIACSVLLASLARSIALIRSFSRSLPFTGADREGNCVYEFDATVDRFSGVN